MFIMFDVKWQLCYIYPGREVRALRDVNPIRTRNSRLAFNAEIIFLQVLNEANLTNAVLVRTVLTRSDLGGALIEGADFSDAVIDLPQKQVYTSLGFVLQL